MDKEQFDKFEELAKPLVEYLRKNHHPHTAVIVTDTQAVIVENVMGVPFPLDD